MSGPTDGPSSTVTIILLPQFTNGGPISFDLHAPHGGVAGEILAIDDEYQAALDAILKHVPQWTTNGPTSPTLEVPADRVKELVQRAWS